jgi:hypothetical protein
MVANVMSNDVRVCGSVMVTAYVVVPGVVTVTVFVVK